MFFQKAYEGENEWWKWLLTPVLALGGYFIGQFPLGIAMIYFAAKNDLINEMSEPELEEVMLTADFETLGIDLNLALFLALLMFVVMGLSLALFLKVLHRRHWKSLITPLERINWSKIFFSFGLWLAFTLVIESVSYFMAPESYILTFNLSKFIPLLLIVLLLLPIQTSVEELFFRGYLMQAFGVLTKNKWVAAVVTSLMFSGMHMMNPEVAEFGMGIMFAYYASVGFFLALLTIMDDSLELALGVHAATNMFSALFMSYEGGALQTNAIFRTDVVDVTLMLPVFYVVATVFFVICWKKYKWEGWTKLMEPIHRPPEPPIEMDATDVLDA